MTEREEVLLAGCHPTPLSSYLKALAVLRITGEQLDAGTHGAWRADGFQLTSSPDAEGLQKFFLNDYVPTPVVAPWNGGSGFFEKDRKDGILPIGAAGPGRFAAYAEAISTCGEVLAALNLVSSPKGEAKVQLLRLLRASLADCALEWLDAAVVLTAKDARYPPLLGTGGNDGRLDFTNNFMQHLVRIFDVSTGEPRAGVAPLLRSSLLGEATPSLSSSAVGQFDPGGAGGPNAGAGYQGASQVNPWDFVLMIEGALVFTGSATKRFSAAAGTRISYPFTVRSTAGGAGNVCLVDETAARHEIWLPLWKKPATIGEIRTVFSEGRLALGRRVAEDGLDVVRAIAALGVDRGIEAFQRYGFFRRAGKAYLAVPMNRVDVRRNVAADLLADLDRGNWLRRVRRRARDKEAPARFHMLARNLDNAVFDLTRSQGEPSAVQGALTAVAAIERYVGSSPKLHDDIQPVSVLDAGWMQRCDDGSPEFRIAAAVASLSSAGLPPLRSFVYPQRVRGRKGKPKASRGLAFEWAPGSPTYVWRQADLEGCMVAVLARRLLDAGRTPGGDGDPTESRAVRSKPVDGRRGASLAAIQEFIAGGLDQERIRQLIEGFALVLVPLAEAVDAHERPTLVPAPYALLKLLFVPENKLKDMKVLAEKRSLPIPPGLIRALVKDSPSGSSAAVRMAQQRLRASGVAIELPHLNLVGINPRRLAAALLIPLAWSDIRMLCDRLLVGRETSQEGVSA